MKPQKSQYRTATLKCYYCKKTTTVEMFLSPDEKAAFQWVCSKCITKPNVLRDLMSAIELESVGEKKKSGLFFRR